MITSQSEDGISEHDFVIYSAVSHLVVIRRSPALYEWRHLG